MRVRRIVAVRAARAAGEGGVASRNGGTSVRRQNTRGIVEPNAGGVAGRLVDGKVTAAQALAQVLEPDHQILAAEAEAFAAAVAKALVPDPVAAAERLQLAGSVTYSERSRRMLAFLESEPQGHC